MTAPCPGIRETKAGSCPLTYEQATLICFCSMLYMPRREDAVGLKWSYRACSDKEVDHAPGQRGITEESLTLSQFCRKTIGGGLLESGSGQVGTKDACRGWGGAIQKSKR